MVRLFSFLFFSSSERQTQTSWLYPFPDPVGSWAAGAAAHWGSAPICVGAQLAGLAHPTVWTLLSVLTSGWWPRRCSSKCGPWASSTGISRELVRNAASQAPAWASGVRNSGAGPSTLCYQVFRVILKHPQVHPKPPSPLPPQQSAMESTPAHF